MRALGIVPARRGSTRLPDKNVLQLGGKPLAQRVLETALAAHRLTKVVVTSDDERVLDLARAHGGSLVLRRPAVLATADAPPIAYVRHALQAVEEGGEAPFEAVVILQPSSPLTLPEDVDRTLELLERTGADTAVTVVRLAHDLHPAKFKVLQGDRLLPYLEAEGGRMAASELPPVYVRNGSVYATRRRVIEAGAIIGEDCRGLEMSRLRSVDINDGFDFAFAEWLCAHTEGAETATATPRER